MRVHADGKAVAEFGGQNQPPAEFSSISPEIASALGMNESLTRPGQTRAPKPRPSATPAKPKRSPSATTQKTIEPDSTVANTGASRGKTGDRQDYSGAMKGGGGMAATLPPPNADAGDKLGIYELLKKLGEGGMGAVYLAKQTTLDRNVALKVLSPKLSNAPALIGRFMREAYAAGQLVHHNVVQIYDFGREKVAPGSGKAAGLSGGKGGETHYFSMEFVDGGSLQNKLAELPDKRMDPREAVGHILQAARGLAFAHEHGLIHRDVKPDNLMLNRLGIVKVADLGLVKQISESDLAAAPSTDPDAETAAPGGGTIGETTKGLTGTIDPDSVSSAASAQITQHGAMMGTPAYLPPEQASDAKSTDGRADIYSLGATLYHLVVGKPPFSGRTLQELLDAHRFKPLKFPDPETEENAPQLSRSLKEILRKMMAKAPADRHAHMAEVVEDLEAYLRDKHDAQLEAGEEQQKKLQWAATEFKKSGWAKLRTPVIIGFAVAVLLGAIAVFWGSGGGQTGFGASGGVIGFGVLTFAFGFVLVGLARRDALFAKFREYVLGASLTEWALMLGGLLLVGWVVWNLGWAPWWAGAATFAALAGWAYANVVDKGVRDDREPMVAQAQRVVRDMRAAGADEHAVKMAVAEAAGDGWEGFYESLFGFKEKLDARRIFGIDDRGRHLPKDGAWREPVLRWIEDRLEHRRLKRDRQLIQALAENELVSKGVKREVAQRQAQNQAMREVGKATMIRDDIRRELREELRDVVREELDEREDEDLSDERGRKIKRRKVKYTEEGFERIHESYFKRRYGSVWDLVLGQAPRFVVAAVLLACFALWFNQNQQEILVGEVADAGSAVMDDLEDRRNRTDAAAGSIGAEAEDADLQAEIDRAAGNRGRIDLAGGGWYAGRGRSVEISGVPTSLTRWVSGWRTGIAGLLLGLSSFFYGRALGVLSLAAAGVSLAGTVLWFDVLNLPPELGWIPIATAAALWAGTIFFLRRDDE